MTTAIMSDLHLGSASGLDLARRPEPLSRLLDVASAADRIVFLGDLLELREHPAAAVLDDIAPVLRRIGEATAGKQVVVAPGNHDYPLVGPALERARLVSGGGLPLDGLYRPEPGELAGRVAALMPDSELVIAYPGIRLRDDVYAMHGHYLDVHLTVPRIECLIAAAIERYASGIGPAGPTAPEHYEAILSPIYSVAHAFAQNARAGSVTRGNSLSRTVWSTATGNGGGAAKLKRTLVGRAAIPTAVAAINAAGLGPFNSDISAQELRRAGLRAMGDVVERLGIDADYVIFGHTHRAGPLEGDADEWRLTDGTQLVNSGTWIHEDVFVDGDGQSNPYWPGRVVLLDESGPPKLTTVLDAIPPTLGS